MTITYTNNQEVVTESLFTIISGEFSEMPIIFSNKFEDERLTKSKYLRYWITENRIISSFNNGELREYDIEILLYYNLDMYNVSTEVKEIIGEDVERLVQLLNSNFSYTPSGTYKWHSLIADVPEFPIDLLESDDMEIEGRENIKAARLNILINRSNFWG